MSIIFDITSTIGETTVTIATTMSVDSDSINTTHKIDWTRIIIVIIVCVTLIIIVIIVVLAIILDRARGDKRGKYATVSKNSNNPATDNNIAIVESEIVPVAHINDNIDHQDKLASTGGHGDGVKPNIDEQSAAQHQESQEGKW